MAEYIEREALTKVMLNGLFPNKKIETEFDVLRAIEKAPAADVVEVRHRYWEEQLDGTHYCSECGHDATYTYDGTEICGIACPFCGAKMDGKGDGE